MEEGVTIAIEMMKKYFWYMGFFLVLFSFISQISTCRCSLISSIWSLDRPPPPPPLKKKKNSKCFNIIWGDTHMTSTFMGCVEGDKTKIRYVIGRRQVGGGSNKNKSLDFGKTFQNKLRTKPALLSYRTQEQSVSASNP